MESLRELATKNHIHSPIEFNERNYQTLLSITETKILLKDNHIVYHLTIPLPEENEWDIKHIIPIPEQKSNAFVIPLIENNIIFDRSHEYIPLDLDYLKACKKIEWFYLCKRTRPSHSLIGNHDCQSDILKVHTHTLNHCQIGIFKIQEITYVPLYAQNSFIIIPAKPLQIQTLCKTSEIHTLQQPSLIVNNNEDCILLSETTVMKIAGKTVTSTYNIFYKNISIKYTPKQLNTLHDTLPIVPVILQNVNQYRTNLDQMDQQLQGLQNEKRMTDWKETGWTSFQILSYLALGSILAYGLFRGFKCIAPGTLKIKICCPKSKTTNQTVHQIQPPTYQELRLQEEAEPIIFTPTKRVRFGGPNPK